MPFTISQAGFVLPLKGILSAQVLCGLMIGSIVPDFGYFIREFGIASFAHTAVGAICVSLPIGLAMYFLVSLFFNRIANILPKPHSSYLRSWGMDGPCSRRNWIGLRRYCRVKECGAWQDLRSWVFLLGPISVTLLLAAGLNAEWIPDGVNFYALRVFAFQFLITWLPLVGADLMCYAMIRPLAA